MTLYRDDYTKCDICWAWVKRNEKRLVIAVADTAAYNDMTFEDVLSAFIRSFHRSEHE